MSTIYDRLGLELLEKMMGFTTFNSEQLNLISKGMKNSTKVLDLGIGLGNLAKLLVEQDKVVYGKVMNNLKWLNYNKEILHLA